MHLAKFLSKVRLHLDPDDAGMMGFWQIIDTCFSYFILDILKLVFGQVSFSYRNMFY